MKVLFSPTLQQRYPQLPWLLRGGRRIQVGAARFLNAIEAFATEELAPAVAGLDAMGRRGELPQALLARCCELHLFSAMFPASVGGLGLPPLVTMIGLELLASYSVGFANLVGVNGLAIACVAATMDMRALGRVARLVTDLERRGEVPFLSTCVTEPGSGSDAEDSAMIRRNPPRTIAKPVPGGYLLNGSKVFISNGSLAQMHVVLAVEDRQRPVETLRVLLVPAESPGVKVVRIEHKLGQSLCPAAEMLFTDVFVEEALLCRCSADFAMGSHGLPAVLGLTRGGVAAFAAGGAAGVSRVAGEQIVARRREPVRGWWNEQWVDEELARLELRAMQARAAFLNAAIANEAAGLAALLQQATRPSALLPGWLRALVLWLMSRPIATIMTHRLAASMPEAHLHTTTVSGDAAKVGASELAWQNARCALRLVGAQSTFEPSSLGQFLRDIRLLSIYEGTNQINLLDLYERALSSSMSVPKAVV